ncbi:hypothetical protein [Helicobacter pylori]|nr:hypothetical protein [Helicobacter pylori]
MKNQQKEKDQTPLQKKESLKRKTLKKVLKKEGLKKSFKEIP